MLFLNRSSHNMWAFALWFDWLLQCRCDFGVLRYPVSLLDDGMVTSLLADLTICIDMSYDITMICRCANSDTISLSSIYIVDAWMLLWVKSFGSLTHRHWTSTRCVSEHVCSIFLIPFQSASNDDEVSEIKSDHKARMLLMYALQLI